MGRHDGDDRRPCAEFGCGRKRTSSVPDLRRQLCTSRLSGHVVSAVRFVYVSVSWRRLLCQRRAGIGSAAPRPVSPHVAGARRSAADSSSTLSDFARHVVGREEPRMSRILYTIGGWLEARLCLRMTLWPMLTHPVPKSVGGPIGR